VSIQKIPVWDHAGLKKQKGGEKNGMKKGKRDVLPLRRKKKRKDLKELKKGKTGSPEGKGVARWK